MCIVINIRNFTKNFFTLMNQHKIQKYREKDVYRREKKYEHIKILNDKTNM